MEANHKTDRGQVGIGTLIVFIAMVLVAAIAAGVLINTAGFLQSQSEKTGEESTSQVSDRLQAVAITGDNISSEEIGTINVTVSQSPGAQDINLENVTAQWVGPGGTFNLVNESVVDDTTTNKEYFSTEPFKDADGSHPTLNDADDRLVMTFYPGRFSERLGEGEEVELRLTAQSGSTSIVRISAPQSLNGLSAVAL
jgi:flagellin-like protein